MKKKGWNIFRIILGCYLIFLGASLAFQVNRENPTNKNLMMVFAVFFILVGIVYALFTVKDAFGSAFHLKGGHIFGRKKKKNIEDITVEIKLDDYTKNEKILEAAELTPPPEKEKKQDKESVPDVKEGPQALVPDREQRKEEAQSQEKKESGKKGPKKKEPEKKEQGKKEPESEKAESPGKDHEEK